MTQSELLLSLERAAREHKRLFDNIEPCPMTGCWIWTNSVSKDYGLFSREPFKRAHRASWEIHFGPIPDGLHVCHFCDVPLCVNPGHLFLGTARDNARDCVRKGRRDHAGENNPTAVLTADQVTLIRADSRSHSEVARAFGMSYNHIRAIRLGEKWKLPSRAAATTDALQQDADK